MKTDIEVTQFFATHTAMLHALHRLDPFQNTNSQGVVYAETPCWSLLAMPVPEIHSEEYHERKRRERRASRLHGIN